MVSSQLVATAIAGAKFVKIGQIGWRLDSAQKNGDAKDVLPFEHNPVRFP